MWIRRNVRRRGLSCRQWSGSWHRGTRLYMASAKRPI